MRIDLTLKYLCLVKTRSIAKALCEDDRVLIDGVPARASTRVRDGARVSVHFSRHTISVEVISVPEKQLSKSTAVTYYRRVETPAAEQLEDPDTLDDL